MPDTAAPVIVVVDTDPATAAAVRHRFDRDYAIVEAAADLGEVRDADRVALVLAEAAPAFTAAAQRFPDARRALLIPWGAWADAGTAARVRTLMAEVRIDFYLVRPRHDADEGFHRTVTEFLREWRGATTEHSGFVVIGAETAPRAHQLRALLARSGRGVDVVEPTSDEASRILTAAGLRPGSEPVVRTIDGKVLVDPSDAEIARVRGLSTDLPAGAVDVAIVGAGPAGLAAAVYAASEGLVTLVLERGTVGGQAGTSSLIRNYLGFPRGVAGAELAERAYQQAWTFGARFAHAREATALALDDGFAITVGPGDDRVTARSIVLATGVSYRRLSAPGLRRFAGVSVFYGASSVEARAQRGRTVCVVGGGNSAGQAALHLARYAASVTLLVRGAALAASMSHYLIEQLDARGVRVVHGARVVDGVADGAGRLVAIEVEHGGSAREPLACDALFVTIGARPRTAWLPAEVRRDRWGSVFTGSSPPDDDDPEPWAGRTAPGALETSVPGLFAVGDTRRGALQRVASAVGEGSVVISAVHAHLARS